MGARVDGARVLVVDDDRDSATTICRVLAVAGFEVATVPSARLARRVLLEERVAAVVVSFAGKGVGATTDLVAGLRGRPEPALSTAGVVALVDDATDAAFGLGAESDAVLVRPLAADRLVDAVTEGRGDHTVDADQPADRAPGSCEDVLDAPDGGHGGATDGGATDGGATDGGGPLSSVAPGPGGPDPGS